MPLIIITGLPSSGKTFRAQQIAADLNSLIASDPAAARSKRSVQIVPSHHASSDDEPYNNDNRDPDSVRRSTSENLRDQIYSSAAQEKTARAEEFSAIKRALSKDTIVIADGLNYIKGYRYQLWCEAKAAGTRCCVVHVAALEEQCKQWNRERLKACGRLRGDDSDSDEKIAGAIEKQEPGKQGKDVLGELVPESHTAIYGDRVVRSRSSSLDVGEEGVGPGSQIDEPSKPKLDDTMTLKSLYITDKQGVDTPVSARSRIQTSSGQLSPSPPPSSPATETEAIPPLPSAHLTPPPPTSSPPYSPATLLSLAMRYEPPSPFSRWDTPLFTIPSSDPTPPTREIWTALFPPPARPTSKKALSQIPKSQIQSQTQSPSNSSKAVGRNDQTDNLRSDAATAYVVKPHAATVLPKATASDALQILESATMDVARHVLARAREQGEALAQGDGGDISLSIPTATAGDADTDADPDATFDTMLHVPAGLVLSQPLLQRLRRKYTQIQRGGIAHGQGYVHGRRAVVEGFIEFLDSEWNDSE
ncbi:hypothetical protein A1O1_03819 [Capronia coronata CBS 617.96]|uniref:Protein KTI12 n=1 Tax=Capronia coronata CBS 617.96 TaxID=1182541 RepID=W9YM07_9EURO|nr:uncharacterized protein A1O1_03819 [Capronia coronata CBS 617.96]EXJ90715.1 hypothetical protein A1O1_03819 [Capronia coronata CBS 617.96]